MKRQRASSPPVVTATVDVVDLATPAAARTYRGELRRRLAPGRELRWARVLSAAGVHGRAGVPARAADARRVVVAAAWIGAPGTVPPPAPGAARCHWTAALSPFVARGTVGGETPFTDLRQAPPIAAGEPVAVLTLARVPLRRLRAFAAEDARVTDGVLRAPGLVTALSAGSPRGARLTLSIWESLEPMVAFAHRDPAAGHRDAIARHRDEPLLRELLVLRCRPMSIAGTWEPAGTVNAEALARLATQLGGAPPPAGGTAGPAAG